MERSQKGKCKEEPGTMQGAALKLITYYYHNRLLPKSP